MAFIVLIIVAGLIYYLVVSVKNNSVDLTKEHLTDLDSIPFADLPDPGDTTPAEQKIPANPQALSGKCGNTVTWRLADGYHLILEGYGETWDYNNCRSGKKDYEIWPTWKYQIDKIKKITVGKDITWIGCAIFHDLKNLTEVNFLGRLKSIPSECFWGCSSLVSIRIPEGIENIGFCAFTECTSLRNVIFPQSLLEIGACAFDSCPSLTSIDLPNSLEDLGSDVFAECPNLKQIAIPRKTHVDQFALRYSGIQKVYRK